MTTIALGTNIVLDEPNPASPGSGLAVVSHSSIPPRGHRHLAGALDALVRAVRTNARSAVDVARNLHNLWTKDVSIEVAATSLRVDDHIELEVDADRGPWVLPAFMAGLRKLERTEACTQEQLVALAERLASLRFEVDALRSFRDWVWEDGAEGFDLVVDTGFVEAVEARAVREHRATVGVGAVRSPGIVPMTEGVRVSAEDLDLATALADHDGLLHQFVTLAQMRAFEMQGGELREAREKVIDVDRWAELELDMILGIPALRERIAPHRLARRIASAVRSGPQGIARLELLAGMPDDAHALQTLKARDIDSWVSALLEGMDRAPSMPARLASVIVSLPGQHADAFRSVVAWVADSETRAFAGAIVRELIIREVLLADCPVEAWPHEHACELARLLSIAAPGMLPQYIERLDDAAATLALAALPTREWLPLESTVDRLVSKAGRTAEAVLGTLISGDDESLELLAKVVSTRPATIDAVEPAQNACRRLATTQIGRGVLVDVVRKRKGTLVLQLAALRALRTDEASLRIACSSSWREWFAPPQLRTALKVARRFATRND